MIFLFLVVLFGLFVLECILTETENFGWATLTLVVCAILSTVIGRWFHVYSIADFIHDHGAFTLVYVLAYFVVGIVWSFIKWFSYLMGFRDAFRTLKESFLKDKNLDSKGQIPENLRGSFSDYVRQNARWDNRYRSQLWSMERPRSSQNKARITAWASFWPFSFVGTVLNDPVRRIFNYLFKLFKEMYQKLSDHVFRQDLELK